METLTLRPVAHIRNDHATKFGVPRQAGLAEAVESLVVFEREFRVEAALRGVEGFTHLWLIWGFHKAERSGWSPTVRPPRLGGNRRMGVFATRSPFRPNPIALSCVRLLGVETGPGGPVLRVAGADMMDGTPIYDIKPYLPYADCRPDASGGWTDELPDRTLSVDFPAPLLSTVPEEKRPGLLELLGRDPRPSYQDDPDRRYGMEFAGLDIRFTVSDGTLHVLEVLERSDTTRNLP